METKPVYDWPEFEEEIHFGTNQLKRIDSALPLVKKVTNLNVAQKSCEIHGNAKVPYFVTSSSCGCVDFSRNHKEVPCKHMYALMIALGKFDPAPYREAWQEYQKALYIPMEIDAFSDWPATSELSNIDKCMESANFRLANDPSFCRFSLQKLDTEKQEAVFVYNYGGFLSNKEIHTTLNSCTCEDSLYSTVPCKHMLRLAVELGMLDRNGRKPIILCDKTSSEDSSD